VKPQLVGRTSKSTIVNHCQETSERAKVHIPVVDISGESSAHRFLFRILAFPALRGGITGNDISNRVSFDSFAL